MKMHKKCLIPLLVAVMLLSGVARGAETPDLLATGQITVTTRCGDEAIPGVALEIYRISTMEETGELTVEETFRDYAQDLDIRGKNDSAWREMALALQQDIRQRELEPMARICSDDQGCGVFSQLPLGLYLILGGTWETENYVYAWDPFFALVPEMDTENQNGIYQVDATAKLEKNPVTMDYRVIKIWEDACHASQRPGEITIHLLQDGEVYDTVTLPKDGRWQYTWEGLEGNHVWTVEEEVPAGYGQPEITREGNTFTIVNTCDKPGEPEQPDLPQTGQLWWPVPILVLGGIICLAIGLIRRRNV